MNKKKSISREILLQLFLILTIVIFALNLSFIFLGIAFFVWASLYGLVERKKYKEFLNLINGAHFFCYNNRKDSKDFIEKNILPQLTPDIKIIYLDGRIPKSEYQQEYISKMLHSIKDRKGFPYLLKISNGKLVDKSINNEFYNTMNQNKDIGHLSKTIIKFYQKY